MFPGKKYACQTIQQLQLRGQSDRLFAQTSAAWFATCLQTRVVPHLLLHIAVRHSRSSGHSCCRCHGPGCPFAYHSATTNVGTYCTAQSLTLLLVPMVCWTCEAESVTCRLQASVHCCLMSQGLLGWLRKLRKTRGEVSSPSVQVSRCIDLLRHDFQRRPGYSF